MFKTITLKPTKEKSILRRHPWVFSGAIKAIENGISNGDIVEIISNKERFLPQNELKLIEKHIEE